MTLSGKGEVVQLNQWSKTDQRGGGFDYHFGPGHTGCGRMSSSYLRVVGGGGLFALFAATCLNLHCSIVSKVTLVQKAAHIVRGDMVPCLA